MILVILLLLSKFACTNFAIKCSDVNLLNSWLVIYLSWSVVILFSISLMFVLYSDLLTKLLTLGILLSTAVRAAVSAKLVILGISHLT